MQEFSTKAVVIKSIDYAEKDKIITLLSPEFGRISAKIKGVRGDKAKLKFACQPFCFADFTFIKTNDKLQVKNVSCIDNFYEITSDYSNYENAIKMLQYVNKDFMENQMCGTVFVHLVKCLNDINNKTCNSKNVLLFFALKLLEEIGYKLNFEKCSTCNCSLQGKKYINLFSNSFTCIKCFESGSKEISEAVFNTLKNVSQTEFKRLNSLIISDKIFVDCVKLLELNFENINKKML